MSLSCVELYVCLTRWSKVSWTDDVVLTYSIELEQQMIAFLVVSKECTKYTHWYVQNIFFHKFIPYCGLHGRMLTFYRIYPVTDLMTGGQKLFPLSCKQTDVQHITACWKVMVHLQYGSSILYIKTHCSNSWSGWDFCRTRSVFHTQRLIHCAVTVSHDPSWWMQQLTDLPFLRNI